MRWSLVNSTTVPQSGLIHLTKIYVYCYVYRASPLEKLAERENSIILLQCYGTYAGYMQDCNYIKDTLFLRLNARRLRPG